MSDSRMKTLFLLAFQSLCRARRITFPARLTDVLQGFSKVAAASMISALEKLQIKQISTDSLRNIFFYPQVLVRELLSSESKSQDVRESTPAKKNIKPSSKWRNTPYRASSFKSPIVRSATPIQRPNAYSKLFVTPQSIGSRVPNHELNSKIANAKECLRKYEMFRKYTANVK